MIPEGEALWLRLRDLAREQKAAVESGRLDDAIALAGRRGELLLEIQNIDVSSKGGKPAPPELLFREILALDEEAVKTLRVGMQDISRRLEKINTFKVLCQGALDGVRTGGGASAP